MRISELARRGGTPVPTVKYYLREGLIPPGRRTSANQAEYGDEHLVRLKLVKALGGVPGLSIQKIKQIVELIDDGSSTLLDGLALATEDLPPYQEQDDTHGDSGEESYPLARALLEDIGLDHDSQPGIMAPLDRALETATSAGIPLEPERLRAYAEHMMAIAEYEVKTMPGDKGEAVVYATAGTVLYEPILLALRRIALQEHSIRALNPEKDRGKGKK